MSTFRRAATTAALTLGVLALAVPAPALADDHAANSGLTDYLFAGAVALVQFLAAAT
ncbi:hypothetical protein [Streptomyces sp. NPDC002537]